MQHLLNQQSDAKPTPSVIESTSPNWDLVPFDVSCARCGHDLRGLTDPVCPACKLEFEWSVAVPIEELTCLKCDYHLYGLKETRCPECGTAFTWPHVLEEYHRKRNPLFEYRWREGPIRSFVRTWVMTLRPRRFWIGLDMHDPARVRPLLIYGLAATIVFFLSLTTFVGSAFCIRDAYQFSRRLGIFDWTVLTRLPQYWLDAAGVDEPYLFTEHVLLWWCCSVLALLVFQQSMRQCKLRTVHVIRITVYAHFAFLPIAAVAAFAAILLNSLPGIPNLDFSPWIIPATLVFVVWSLRCAYTHYAKMKLALVVVISSQLIALLAVVMVGGWIHGQFFAGSLLYAICRFLGIRL